MDRGELADRLEPIVADHLRLASWNKGKDRPARTAYHHDAVLTLRDTQAALRRQPSVEEVEAVLRKHIHRTSRLYSVRTGERKYGVGGYHEAARQIAALYQGKGEPG
jgi:hypothetical protein